MSKVKENELAKLKLQLKKEESEAVKAIRELLDEAGKAGLVDIITGLKATAKDLKQQAEKNIKNNDTDKANENLEKMKEIQAYSESFTVVLLSGENDEDIFDKLDEIAKSFSDAVTFFKHAIGIFKTAFSKFKEADGNLEKISAFISSVKNSMVTYKAIEHTEDIIELVEMAKKQIDDVMDVKEEIEEKISIAEEKLVAGNKAKELAEAEKDYDSGGFDSDDGFEAAKELNSDELSLSGEGAETSIETVEA